MPKKSIEINEESDNLNDVKESDYSYSKPKQPVKCSDWGTLLKYDGGEWMFRYRDMYYRINGFSDGEAYVYVYNYYRKFDETIHKGEFKFFPCVIEKAKPV